MVASLTHGGITATACSPAICASSTAATLQPVQPQQWPPLYVALAAHPFLTSFSSRPFPVQPQQRTISRAASAAEPSLPACPCAAAHRMTHSPSAHRASLRGRYGFVVYDDKKDAHKALQQCTEQMFLVGGSPGPVRVALASSEVRPFARPWPPLRCAPSLGPGRVHVPVPGAYLLILFWRHTLRQLHYQIGSRASVVFSGGQRGSGF